MISKHDFASQIMAGFIGWIPRNGFDGTGGSQTNVSHIFTRYFSPIASWRYKFKHESFLAIFMKEEEKFV